MNKYYEEPCATDGPKRDPDVINSVRRLHEAIETLSQNISALGSRLDVVTRNEATAAGKENLTRSGQCSLSCQIIEAENRIAGLSIAVREQINLLEI